MSGVAIVDSGANYASVCGALRRCGADFTLTHDAATLRRARQVILPGVGNVGDTWSRLQHYGLTDTLRELKQPVLGICVGMQVMFEHCKEAAVDTLGIFSGQVRRLPHSSKHRIPHCGWNQIRVRRESPLTDALADVGTQYVYFVHSFAADVSDQTLATTDHGVPFCAAAMRGNFYGVQFHPERSAALGHAWLNAFLQL